MAENTQAPAGGPETVSDYPHMGHLITNYALGRSTCPVCHGTGLGSHTAKSADMSPAAVRERVAGYLGEIPVIADERVPVGTIEVRSFSWDDVLAG